jgi:hypothetical protein
MCLLSSCFDVDKCGVTRSVSINRIDNCIAEISKLVRKGMPLNSIAAAKEWHAQHWQLSFDDALKVLSGFGESGSPDPVAAFVFKLQHVGIASSHGSTGLCAPPLQTLFQKECFRHRNFRSRCTSVWGSPPSRTMSKEECH